MTGEANASNKGSLFNSLLSKHQHGKKKERQKAKIVAGGNCRSCQRRAAKANEKKQARADLDDNEVKSPNIKITHLVTPTDSDRIEEKDEDVPSSTISRNRW